LWAGHAAAAQHDRMDYHVTGRLRVAWNTSGTQLADLETLTCKSANSRTCKVLKEAKTTD